MVKETIRGVDHIGVLVPDIEAAKTFFINAFGAQFMYQSLSHDNPPAQGEQLEHSIGIAPGSIMRGQCLLRLGRGPDLELLEIEAPGQVGTSGRSDFGLNHLALYVDDHPAAITRFEAAGGRMLACNEEIPFKTEAGDGNAFSYGVTPWGMNVEFISYPGEMGYEKDSPLRRWHRGS